jgi:thioredoxin-like negative regulator of GroEL
MESLQSEMSITFIDVDSSPQTAQQYNVRSVPTVLILENGVEKRRLVGAKPLAEIRSAYNG